MSGIIPSSSCYDVDIFGTSQPPSSQLAILRAQRQRAPALLLRRPHSPVLSSPPVVLQRTTHSSLFSHSGSSSIAASERGLSAAVNLKEDDISLSHTHNVKTGTVRREVDSQTASFLPDFSLSRPLTSRTAELILLAYSHKHELVGTKGAAATEAQALLIERLREKIRLESLLPPSTDSFSLAIRTRLMEEAEFLEWRRREESIAEIQDKRLSLVKQTIQKFLAREIFLKVSRKVEKLKTRKMQRLEEKLTRTEQLKSKLVRRVKTNKEKALKETSRLGLLEKEKKIIRGLKYSKFIDPASELFAPLGREGKQPDRGTGRVEVLPADLHKLVGLNNILERLNDYLINKKLIPGINKSGRADDDKNLITFSSSSSLRQKRNIALERKENSKRQDLLSKAYILSAKDIMKRERQASTKKSSSLSSMTGHNNISTLSLPLEMSKVGDPSSVGDPIPASNNANMSSSSVPANSIGAGETPRVLEEVSRTEEAAETSALYFQRVLRGRAKQLEMFLSKQKRFDLIQELILTEDLPPPQSSSEVGISDDDAQIEDMLDELIGEEVADSLDFLSKELVRLEEERRISCMTWAALRDRRIKEAEEGGRRQQEEKRREKEDETFERIMAVGHLTVDSFINDIFTDSKKSSLYERRSSEIKYRSNSLIPIIPGSESVVNSANPTNTAASHLGTEIGELLTGFLYPHVDREREKKKVSVKQQSIKSASRDAILSTINSVLESPEISKDKRN